MRGCFYILVAVGMIGCAGRGEPEPEVPDLLADENPKELFPELEGQTRRRLHATLTEAEHLHRSQKPEPCARAWADLEVLMNAGRPVQTESARFFGACGCCTAQLDEDEDGGHDATRSGGQQVGAGTN
jgi:hypothetical protein